MCICLCGPSDALHYNTSLHLSANHIALCKTGHPSLKRCKKSLETWQQPWTLEDHIILSWKASYPPIHYNRLGPDLFPTCSSSLPKYAVDNGWGQHGQRKELNHHDRLSQTNLARKKNTINHQITLRLHICMSHSTHFLPDIKNLLPVFCGAVKRTFQGEESLSETGQKVTEPQAWHWLLQCPGI